MYVCVGTSSMCVDALALCVCERYEVFMYEPLGTIRCPGSVCVCVRERERERERERDEFLMYEPLGMPQLSSFNRQPSVH